MDYRQLLDKNFKPSPEDPRDYLSAIAVPADLPQEVDLMPDVVEVEDQKYYNSCTANAGCSALELMYNKRGRVYDFSRLFLYYYVRQLGNILGDNGAYPRDIAKALRNYGVCPEDSWGYVDANLDTPPPAEVQAEAAPFRIASYEQLVGNKLLQIKAAVAQGIPVLMAMKVHGGFFSLKGVWKSHSWNNVTSSTNPLEGYHEVLVIGYDDVTQRILVQNSWGPAWGDGGFFGMPYGIVLSDTVTELWIVNPNYNTDVVIPPEKKKFEIPTIWKWALGGIALIWTLWFFLH